MEFKFYRRGRYLMTSNLWCSIDGDEPHLVNYTETEAQWVAKEFPHHILFIRDEE